MSSEPAGAQARRRPQKKVNPTWDLERVMIWASIVFCAIVVLFYSYQMPALGAIFIGITTLAVLPVLLGDRVRQKGK